MLYRISDTQEHTGSRLGVDHTRVDDVRSQLKIRKSEPNDVSTCTCAQKHREHRCESQNFTRAQRPRRASLKIINDLKKEKEEEKRKLPNPIQPRTSPKKFGKLGIWDFEISFAFSPVPAFELTGQPGLYSPKALCVGSRKC